VGEERPRFSQDVGGLTVREAQEARMGRSPGEADEFAFLSDLVFSEETLESILNNLVALTVREVVEADGATITMVDGGSYRTTVSTSEEHRFIDLIQYAQGEGPCLSAITEERIIVADFEDPKSPWPEFSQRAAERAVYHSISAPLAAHGPIMGSLNVYSNDREGAFAPDAAKLIEMLATWAATMLRNFELYSLRGELVQQLYEALESRAAIDLAKGVLMERHKMTPVQAFEHLKKESQKRNVKLRDVAGDLIAPD
jgi:GAF domain-containing protein